MILELLPIEIRRALRESDRRRRRRRRGELGAAVLLLGALGIFVVNVLRL